MQMFDIENISFARDNGQPVTIQEMANIIKEFMNKKPEYTYKCIVGSDSQVFTECVKYVTSIAFFREGNGGIIFDGILKDKGNFIISKADKSRLKEILPMKIFNEAQLTLYVGREIIDPLFLENGIYVDHSVHFDVNSEDSAKTSEYKNAIIGMSQAHGYQQNQIFIKPNAFVASTIADRKTKKL